MKRKTLAAVGLAITLTTLAPPANAQTTNGTAAQVAELHSSVDTIATDIARFKVYARYAVMAGSALVVIVSFFGFSYLKSATRRYVNNNIGKHLTTAVQKELPRLLEEARTRAETYLLRIATFLALRAYKAPDAALKEYGWDGKVASLRTQSPAIRRAVIECLYEADRDRQANRTAAWEAISELLADDASVDTLRLYLRLSVSLRKFQEGYQALSKHGDAIRADKETSLRASTLLRKRGELDAALALVDRFETDTDPETLVHIAVLRRDLGFFDEADDLLRDSVNRMIASPSTALPDGWHRLPNTFIANCIDREKPEDAVQAAEFVMRSSPGAVEVFTAGRLIQLLNTGDPRRAPLVARFQEAIKGLCPGEARLRCQIIALQLEGKDAHAVRTMKEAIEQRPASHGGSLPVDAYYERCTLGRLLIDQDRYDEAIDCLLVAANHNYGGEAKYLLALGYARKQEPQDAVRWLKLAVSELPRWAALARNDSHLKNVREVNEFLASLHRPGPVDART